MKSKLIELESVRGLKRRELVAKSSGTETPLFSEEQLGVTLEFQWLENARSQFFRYGNVYRWNSTEENALIMANEQRCDVIFQEQPTSAWKVMSPSDQAWTYLDAILLSQPIDAFQTSEAVSETVKSLFPQGFADKSFYYACSSAPAVALSAEQAKRRETIFKAPDVRVDEIKNNIRASGCIYPSTLSRPEAEHIIDRKDKLVLRESASVPGEIAITLYNKVSCQYSHCLLKDFILAKLSSGNLACFETIAGTLKAIENAYNPDATISFPTPSEDLEITSLPG